MRQRSNGHIAGVCHKFIMIQMNSLTFSHLPSLIGQLSINVICVLCWGYNVLIWMCLPIAKVGICIYNVESHCSLYNDLVPSCVGLRHHGYCYGAGRLQR